VLNNTEIVIDLGAELTVLLAESNIDITIQTTLGALAGTSDEDPVITAEGNLLGLSLDALLGALTETLIPAVLNILQPAVSGLFTTVGNGLAPTLSGIIDPIAEGLSPVFEVLNQVAEVTINEQPSPGKL